MSPSKYRSVKIEVDGMKFDSKKEYRRWLELKALEEEGQITDLKRQVEYVLIPSQKGTERTERPCKYFADFVYYDINKSLVVEDTKGMRTPEYIIKRKLMKRVFGIEIKEV